MAAINTFTLRETIRNLIDKNNTNTSSFDIGGDIYKQPQNIKAAYHDNKTTKNIDYPFIWVELRNKVDELVLMGTANKSKRNSTVDFDITCIVQTGVGQTGGKDISDDNMIKLANNVENLLRNFPQLSATSLVTQSVITGTEYDVTEAEDFYNSIATIALEVQVFGT